MSALTEGSTTKEHQTTMLMEMAKLVKPEGFSEEQVGSFVDDAVTRTVDIALKNGLIKKDTDLAAAIDKTILEDAAKYPHTLVYKGRGCSHPRYSLYGSGGSEGGEAGYGSKQGSNGFGSKGSSAGEGSQVFVASYFSP
ncbi:hypothetical protein [Paenibacillus luteus]|uniref:hypothetical protein n=1 Tax=Paenibacillus luteus TaxID=2545753 RepID=UPI00158CA8B4|nr:hypothetical protein [Paenibacillus luteus]